MNALRVLTVYRWTFITLIVAASLAAIPAHGIHARHALVLAPAEIAGALLLGMRHTQRLGAALLLLALLAAQILAAQQGIWTTHLLQYSASCVFIVLLDRALFKPRVEVHAASGPTSGMGEC
jgi:hypothetical protein